MAQEQELFVDGIGEIGMVGGVVRIDLVSLSAQQKDAEGKPSMAFRQRLILPPEGFLRMYTTMQGLLNRLEEAGVVQRVSGGPSVATETQAVPSSPNFS